MEELGGVREISKRLGVSRRRVYQLESDPTFPDPAFELEMGRIWFMTDINRWNSDQQHPAKEPTSEPAWVGRRSDAVMASLAELRHVALRKAIRSVDHDGQHSVRRDSTRD